MVAEKKEGIEQIEKLGQFLPEETLEELEQILAYGEKIKVRGEKRKEKFWSKHYREDFLKLLQYGWRYKDEIEGKYKYLSMMSKIERERFIQEYLYEDMLYSGKIEGSFFEKIKKKLLPNSSCGEKYSYEDWKNGKFVIKNGVNFDFSYTAIGDDFLKSLSNIELREGMILNFTGNEIGCKLAEAVSHMELKERVEFAFGQNKLGNNGAITIAKNLRLKKGVILYLWNNGIGPEGAKAIAENWKLKEGVILDLHNNYIGVEGAKAIAENMKFEKGVELDLFNNGIGDEGAKEIVEKMELKEGVGLNLSNNRIGPEGAKIIAKTMELKEGVSLNLNGNQIGDEGAEAIMQNLKLKKGVELDLSCNTMTAAMKRRLRDLEAAYNDKGINCKILV